MAQSDAETPPPTPRWVKVFVLIVILLILLVAVIMFIVGGDHGPGRHAPGMLTGFALLAFHHGLGRSLLEGDTTADDVILSEGGRE